MTPNGLAQVKALIRFYFGTQPKSFEETYADWEQLSFALRFAGKIKDVEEPPKR